MNLQTHESDLLEDIGQVKQELEYLINERERVIYLTKNPLEPVAAELTERIEIFKADLESLEAELFEIQTNQVGC